MTTTLRPTEPLQHAADGTRSRRYRICVNSRPVGTLHLATSASLGGSVAEILELSVAEPDRGRGRGAVAALAAEEIARGWGCRVMETAVPSGAEAALGLVGTLGYLPRNRGMRKTLADTPPDLPEGSRARPMTVAEFDEWSARQWEGYARSWIERGVPEDTARAKARADRERLQPQGIDTAHNVFSVIEHDGVRVGLLWLELARESTVEGGETEAFVYYVEADAAHRGRGHGRALMLLAEAQAIGAGRRVLGLNVFAGNTPAERLYTSLGYETYLHAFQKPLL